MGIRLIGVIKDDVRKTIGYRLFNSNSKEVFDADVMEIKRELLAGGIKIRELEMKNGELTGTNGKLSRYPVIINGDIWGKSPLIVVAQLIKDNEIIGYRVIDWKGDIRDSSTDSAVEYAYRNGIANGCVKTINDKLFISSITGEYDIIEIKLNYNRSDFENIIWSIEDFEEYMSTNNYKYDMGKLHREKSNIKNAVIRIDSDIPMFKFPDGVQNIWALDDYSYKYNTKLLIIPPSVEVLDHRLINKLPNLEKIVLQEGLERLRITGYCHDCMVNEIKFPKSLQYIEMGFSDMLNLNTLDLRDTQIKECVRSFNKLNTEYVTLPESIETIDLSFVSLRNVKEVKFPDNLIRIGEFSFSSSSLKRVDLSKCSKLKSIGSKAFQNCEKLKEVILPEGLKHIGSSAFRNCMNIERLVLPESLEQVRWAAFEGMALDKFVVTKRLKLVDNWCFSKNTIIEFEEDIEVVSEGTIGKSFENVALPKSLKVIGKKAFHGNNSIKTMKIPKNIKIIGEGAFLNCSKLTDVDMRDCRKLKVICDNAFRHSGVIKIILPEGLKIIGLGCFGMCTNLMDVVLPMSLEEIGDYAFKTDNKVESDITFYVYDNSFGLRYCRENGLTYIIIDQNQEAYGNLFKHREVKESTIAKWKMLLGDRQEHKQLLQEPFINNADILYKIYGHINNTDVHRIQQNTDKFIRYNIGYTKQLKNLKILLRNARENVRENINSSNEFEVLSNLITKVLDMDVEGLKKLELEYTYDKYDLTYNTIFTDKHNSIITINIRQKNGDKVIGNMILIVMGEYIRFISTVIGEETDVRSSEALEYKEPINKNRVTGSVADLIKVGDSLMMGSYAKLKVNRIHGACLPEYIHMDVKNNILQNFIIVGRGDKAIEVEKFNKVGGLGVYKINLDLLCKETSNIITVSAWYISDGDYIGNLKGVNELERVFVTDITNIEKIDGELKIRVIQELERGELCSLYEIK